MLFFIFFIHTPYFFHSKINFFILFIFKKNFNENYHFKKRTSF